MTDQYADEFKAIENTAAALGLTFLRQPIGNGGSEMLKIVSNQTPTILFEAKNDTDEVKAFLAGYKAANRKVWVYERAVARLCSEILHFRQRAAEVVQHTKTTLHVELDIADVENERTDE